MEQNVTLADFKDALIGASEDGAQYALIGGLAVGAWADRFGVFDVSAGGFCGDIEVRGDKAASSLIGIHLKELGHEILQILNVRRKALGNAPMNYILQIKIKGTGRASVEVLEKMPLVDVPNEPPRGLVAESGGVLILDPLSLMIGKIHAFNSRRPGQSDNDAKHLELLRRLLPAFMDEACERGLADDIRERATALLRILESWKTPFTADELGGLRAELRRRAQDDAPALAAATAQVEADSSKGEQA
jgi:hypothetical protein